MRTRRAFTLLLVLLFSTLLLLLALTFLSRSAENYRATTLAAEAEKAYELALAGLESARVRLDKDAEFPPSGPRQLQFSCWEPVYEPDGTTVAGYYQLSVDSRWRNAPYQTLRVTAIGCVGAPDAPRARRKLWMEVDLNPEHGDAYFQPNLFRDEGSL